MAYASKQEAQNYVDTYVLDTQEWDEADYNTKIKALNAATALVDRLPFRGEKTDPEQMNEFPRDGDTEVPTDVKNATIELALTLLTTDIEKEIEALLLSSKKIASVGLTFRDKQPPEHLVAGIPSYKAWRFLKPLMDTERILTFNRT